MLNLYKLCKNTIIYNQTNFLGVGQQNEGYQTNAKSYENTVHLNEIATNDYYPTIYNGLNSVLCYVMWNMCKIQLVKFIDWS